jgi:hypothetical protein
LPPTDQAKWASYLILVPKHDPYVEALRDWLHSYGSSWAEQPTISILQGLNDRGVDLKIEFKTAGLNVGFQVKSYGDISNKDFSTKIWQQIGQFRSHAIDHFYIVLCGDMTDSSHYQKVRIFQGSLEQGSYPEISVIPPEQALQLYQSFDCPIDAEEVQTRLTDIARFLEAIDRPQELSSQYSVYLNIEQLYVPPKQYPEVQQVLEANDIVIIVGPPHVGKTFTAVNLLYDYYLQSYRPYWVLGRTARKGIHPPILQDLYHRHGIRDGFSIESRLQPGCIVYFEDPYGRTKQEELEFVMSESRFEIGDLLHILGRRANAEKRPKVIITSREGIFRHAAQRQPELSRYAVWLKAGRGYSEDDEEHTEDEGVSYDFSLRVKIAMKYEHLYQPLWSQPTEEPFDNAKESLEEVLSWAVSLLWTPHSIRRFFQDSQDMVLDDIEALKKTMFESSNISESFASEIALLPDSQRLIFVVTYLASHRKARATGWGNFSSVRSKYLAVAQVLEFTLDEGQLAWSQVLKDYATIIEELGSAGGGRSEQGDVRFAHPAYDDAIARFLSDNPNVLESVFSHIRLLVESEPGTHLAQDMVWLLHHWHRGRPSREAQILEDYLTSDDIGLLMDLAEMYASVYAYVTDQSLKDAIHKLLAHPADTNKTLRGIFLRTAHIASNLPIEKRCEILLAALDDDPLSIAKKFEYRPYDLVCRYYSEVTDQARNHLQNCLKSGGSAWRVVGRSFGHYYDCLPQHLQKATSELVAQDAPHSFSSRQEIIKGFVLGFGHFNKDAHPLAVAMSNSGDHRTRAYLADALVPIYDQLDYELRQRWHRLVEQDCDHCATAAAERILDLSAEQAFAESFKDNGLLDFAIGCAQSDLPAVRAQMVGVLPADPESISFDGIEEVFINLVHDDAPIVRGAILYRMLDSSDLQAKFSRRFQILAKDTSEYARLSKLVFYTNPSTEPRSLSAREVTKLKHSNSQFLHNALLFHISAQLPFLPSHWSDWLEGEVEKGNAETKRIVRIGGWHRSDDSRTRPIFQPDWLLDYTDPDQLIGYAPPMRLLCLKRGHVIIRNLDELTMIFRLKREFPNHLMC